MMMIECQKHVKYGPNGMKGIPNLVFMGLTMTDLNYISTDKLYAELKRRKLEQLSAVDLINELKARPEVTVTSSVNCGIPVQTLTVSGVVLYPKQCPYNSEDKCTYPGENMCSCNSRAYYLWDWCPMSGRKTND